MNVEHETLGDWLRWIDEATNPSLTRAADTYEPEISPRDQLALGRFLLGLRAPGRGYAWITRRFDTITFPDWARQERTTRLELDLWPMLRDPLRYPLWNDSLLVPVMTMHRGVHRTVHVQEEAGNEVVKLSGLHERRLLTLGLLELAARTTGRPPAAVVTALARALSEDDPEYEPLYDFPGPHVEFRRQLRENQAFDRMFRLVRRRSDLIAVIPCPTTTRRMLLTRVIEEAHREGRSTRAQRARSLLLPRPREYYQYLVDAEKFDARSYHIEVNAPYDLELPSAELVVHWSRPSPGLTSQPGEVYASDSPDRTSAHASRSGTDRVVHSGRFSVEMTPSPTGVVRSSVASVTLIACILVGGAVYVWTTPRSHMHYVDRSSATSLLLLAPALVAVLLVSPSQHSLTTRFLLGTRLSVVLSCLLLFIAAVSTALELNALVPLWTGLAGAGILLALRLLYQWQWLIRRRRRATRDRRSLSALKGLDS